MMKTYVLAMLMAVSLASCTKGTVKNSDLVMPNPQLLGCNSSRFQQIWRADYPAADAVYPKQLSFDFKGNCTYGVTAKYDKFTSSDNIRKVIDKDYGQW